MITDKELSRCERDVVLQSMAEDMVDVTVKSKEFGAGYAMFPVAVNACNLRIENENELIIDISLKRSLEPFMETEVTVQFYFNHMGLCFDSVLKAHPEGYCIKIPNSVRRLEKPAEKKSWNFYGDISFTDENNRRTSVSCIPCSGYTLFDIPSWASVPDDIREQTQEVSSQILQDYAIMRLSAGDTLFLINASRYVTENLVRDVEYVEGTFKPLEIIYIDDERIVLGTRDAVHPINIGSDYELNMYALLGSNSRIKRRLSVNIMVEYEYSSSVNGSCVFVCRFTSMQAEDRRYLYEKTAGSLLV